MRRRSREQELMLETSAGGRRGPLVDHARRGDRARHFRDRAVAAGRRLRQWRADHHPRRGASRQVHAAEHEKGTGAQGSAGQPDQRNSGIERGQALRHRNTRRRSGQGFRLGRAPHGRRRAEAHAGIDCRRRKRRHLQAASAGAAGMEHARARRYKASLEIRDKDVEAQLELHKSDKKEDVGYEYIMSPVVFIVPRGSPDAAYEARKRDADTLRARFQSCSEGIPFARALREVAVREQVSKFSADLPQQLRDILDGTAVGHLTPPEMTARGWTDVCGLRQKGDQIGYARDAGDSRSILPAEVRAHRPSAILEIWRRGASDRIQDDRRHK